MGSAERRLVLLRHGRTGWNASRRIQGQLDPALDETGHAQAAAVAPEIAALAPVALISSDLQRARQTTDYVAQATGLTPSYDERLREYSLGERQGLTHEEYAALDPAEYARFRAGDWDDVPGAETQAEVAARFTAVLKETAAALDVGETGLIVAHGAAIRTATVAWLGWPVEWATDFRGLANCGWVELVERPTGRWVLAAYNRTGASPVVE
ncbi:histidine phosphatase family protein [Nocardioides sp. HM23]|uniref:histidine phosphatase family protein n=1 Tax=Nocardioides bizhenqiangii TaxID=3095076 RepID=UPI002ACAC1F8|nr:histidine phosphatase family protein [Nocardioides sp. HM23]MDZ5623194.1 histidine phosphatase family protein [Nocardioides sp. HM23]